MNHPSEWTRYYEPRRGKYMYKHKGTGVISDTLANLGKKIVKPLAKLVFKTASEKVAKNVGEKAADFVTKRGSDKIQELLRKRKKKPPSKVSGKSMQAASSRLGAPTALQQLNNLLAQNPNVLKTKKRKVSQRQKAMQKLNNFISQD